MHAASQARQSAAETPSDRSLRGESRRSDGKATTLFSSRADLAAFRGCHALGTSIRRWGCAGRSYPSHSTSRNPRHGGSEAHGAGKSRPSNLKLALVAYWYGPAVCAGRSRHIWHIADGKRASGGSHTTSKHRAASAGLFAAAGEPASGMFIIQCIWDGRVPLAAAGLRLERRLSWYVRALPW